jgi:4-hydroxybenzoate polyprenyltransferase
MGRNKKINLISILLALTAIAMIVIGVVMKIPAPAITGVGFLLIVWAFQVLK